MSDICRVPSRTYWHSSEITADACSASVNGVSREFSHVWKINKIDVAHAEKSPQVIIIPIAKITTQSQRQFYNAQEENIIEFNADLWR